MKISRLFCGQFLSAPAPAAAELAALLTARGLETDDITPVACAAGIIAGEITACAPHPQADKLQVCAVNIGGGQTLQVVCGAPNARAGLRVAAAPPGATVGAAEITARAIRGVESAGMICSAAELGVGAEKDGIMELTAADGEIGAPLDDALLLNDHVLEINITPNRGDCISHLGIAREIAAAAGLTLKPPAAEVTADNDETFPARIDAAAAEACPYYGCVVLRGADCSRPAPWRWRTLIERCGGRSVSAMVDITNYIMLACGQPLHAFDLDKLQGGIRVRRAAAGERLTMLDGTAVECGAETLLIADEAGALALAGVMGGADSGITDKTRNILLEGAHFTPESVAGCARRYKLNSDAAFRFERGVDFNLPPPALALAAGCARQACGGAIGRLVTAAGAPPAPPPPIALAEAHIGKVLGVPVSAAAAAEMLGGIGLPAKLQTAADGAAALSVQAPSWRFDLKIPEDIIEEIARLHGYDKLPETLPAGLRPPQQQAARHTPAAAARGFFAARGFYEIISYAFVSPAWEQALSAAPPQPLANPMSEEMSVMRTTLWGGLIDRALFNLRRRQERVCLFEIGRCFLPAAAGEELPRQPLMAAGLMYGPRRPTQWGEQERGADFYDIKGVVEMFLARLPLEFKSAAAAAFPALHPGMAAEIFAAGEAVGALGALHPANPLCEDFRAPPLLFSLDLDKLAAIEAAQGGRRKAADISRLPLLRRDLAFIADAALPAGELLAAARALAPAPPVLEVTLFDFYAGDGERVPAGKKSCGLRFVLQGRDNNLTGEEIDQAMEAVVIALQNRYAVELRD